MENVVVRASADGFPERVAWVGVGFLADDAYPVCGDGWLGAFNVLDEGSNAGYGGGCHYYQQD